MFASEKIRNIILFLFLFLVIFTRVYFETALFSEQKFFFYFVVIHHFCWYMAVFFYFAVFARYLLRIKRENISYLTLFSPVIFIPIIHSYFSHKQLFLQYLEGNFWDILFNILTLYKFHPENSYFFVEMLFLLFAFITVSWVVSKDVKRTFLSVVFGFYGSMIFAGLHLFGVYPQTKAYLKIHTVFKNHQLLTLIYFSVALIVFVIYSFPEIHKYFIKNKTLYLVVFFIGMIVSIFTSVFLLQKVYKTELTSSDIFLFIVPCTVLSVNLAAMWHHNSTEFVNGRFFPLFFATISILIIYGICFNVYH